MRKSCFFFFGMIIISLVSCKEDTVRLMGFPIEGIDISHHQKDIQWDSLTDQNFSFVFMKATEGIEHKDTKFDFNWVEAKRIGMKRGAYHFYRPDVGAGQQAVNFIETVTLEEGDLPPVLDFEHKGFKSFESLEDSLRLWLWVVEDYYKVKPIIYTNLNIYNDYIKTHFADYPLWIARYENGGYPISETKSPYIWQYGNRGRISGIDGHVDFNIFLGTQTDFEKLCYSSKQK